MVKSKFTPEQKIQIVLESIRTGTSTADCAASTMSAHRRSITGNRDSWSPARAGLSQSGKKDPIKTMKKREEDYKRLIGELTIANDVLKKTWEESRD